MSARVRPRSKRTGHTVTELEHFTSRILWTTRGATAWSIVWRGWRFEGSPTYLKAYVGGTPLPVLSKIFDLAVSSVTWAKACLKGVDQIKSVFAPVEKVPREILEIEDPDLYVIAYDTWKAQQ